MQNDILRLVGAPNESLRLNKTYYMFKYSFGGKNNLLESFWSEKKPFKGHRSAKLVIRILFWREVNF